MTTIESTKSVSLTLEEEPSGRCASVRRARSSTPSQATVAIMTLIMSHQCHREEVSIKVISQGPLPLLLSSFLALGFSDVVEYA